METASPARLYAAVTGALLFVLGILGFFYSASFGSLDHFEEALGVLQVNGWLNLLYVLSGAGGLILAEVAARKCSLAMGVLYTALAILGWGTVGLHLAIGVLGLAAAAGTPRPARSPGKKVRRPRPKRSPRSKPRAQAAGKSP